MYLPFMPSIRNGGLLMTKTISLKQNESGEYTANGENVKPFWAYLMLGVQTIAVDFHFSCTVMKYSHYGEIIYLMFDINTSALTQILSEKGELLMSLDVPESSDLWSIYSVPREPKKYTFKFINNVWTHEGDLVEIDLQLSTPIYFTEYTLNIPEAIPSISAAVSGGIFTSVLNLKSGESVKEFTLTEKSSFLKHLVIVKRTRLIK